MTIVTKFELETGRKQQRDASFAPSKKLESFEPGLFKGFEPGQYIVEYSCSCGTYGMGGPGFVGFKLNDGQWLLCVIWGADDWLWGREKGDTVGRPIRKDDRTAMPDGSECPEAWSEQLPSQKEELSQHIVGERIVSYTADVNSMTITFGNGFELFIDEDPAKRQAFPSGELRELNALDDMRQAMILSPTHYIWV